MVKRLLGLFVVLAVLLAGLAAPLLQPAAALAAPPDQPTNSSPSDGEQEVSLKPTLRASAFDDPDGDTPASSEWQIAGGPTFIKSVEQGDIREYSIQAGYLAYDTTYSWQVKYKDSSDEWSAPSVLTSFKTVAAPEADFTAPASAEAGASVTFTNTSSGGSGTLICQWDFDNDGDWDSSEKSPSHAYSAPGTYSVTLKVTDSDHVTDTARKSVTVVADLAADFTAEPTTVNLGKAVAFDTTGMVSGGVGTLTYQWDFDNNGTFDGSGPKPSYIYPSQGSKTVRLVVTDSASNTRTVIKEIITVVLGLQADFSADALVVAPGRAVRFNCLVTGEQGEVTYKWDFNGDGRADSSEKSPSHSYTAAGSYTVVLEVTDSKGTVSVTKPDYITVTPTVLAAFSADKTTVSLGQTVQFANQSGGGTAPLAYEWDLNGDGQTDSTDKDPSYTYPTAGTYRVSLKVTDSEGKTDTVTRDRYITVTGQVTGDFTASATDAPPGEAIVFTASVTGGVPPITYQWDFGDGGSSTEATASHAYEAAGVYTVSLTVTDAGGNTDTRKKTGLITVGDVAIAPHAIPANGGVIQTADGRVKATFPAEAYTGSATLTILEGSSSAAPKPPEGYTIGSACFNIEATDLTGRVITSLLRPATVTMKYTTADLTAAGGKTGNLKLAYFTASTGKWTIVATTVNEADQTLSASTTRFSTWAILVKSESRGLAWWAKALIILAVLVVVGIVVWKTFAVKQPERWPGG